MVVKKRIYYGVFHGFIAPVIPKAPRSLRRRSLPTKPSQGTEICAIELLAAVAGKLLQESESSISSTDKHEPLEVKVKPVISEHHDQGSGTESQHVGQPTNLDPPLKEFPHSDNDSNLERASVFTNSDVTQKIGTNLKIEASEDKNVVNDTHSEIQRETIEALTPVKSYGLKDEVESCVNNRVLKKSASRVHLSLYSDDVSKHRGNVKIDIRDDDEKYFRYNHYDYSTRRRAFGSRSRAGYKRIRNILTSRYRKVAPKPKDYGTEVRSFYHKRKNIYMREQYQASKRRKSFHHNSKTTNTKDSHVKFSIKSFKVPELYVEVPETATVGSLKRSVMDAITAILQGQLHVGVLLQGKKVRDDNRTLEQTGISQKCNLETLGFTLEPSLPDPSPSPLQKETPPPSSPITDNNLDKNQENMNLGEVVTDEQVTDSKALMIVPEALDPEILAVVPLNEKTNKRFELSQRRTRRPFSVSEVEALVEAVETLGAGRWRDVKMRAFDDANHRTYVDLKDKWKTLVHTASISPQQRRGEPVPQNLLDRVLAAHAYWSQHQCKPNEKHQKITV
ncbi:hypothetical protein L1887_16584 [Cichorium endivia]|nr:hypothetical protein L1887_16584 [Cichorium endivia]